MSEGIIPSKQADLEGERVGKKNPCDPTSDRVGAKCRGSGPLLRWGNRYGEIVERNGWSYLYLSVSE